MEARLDHLVAELCAAVEALVERSSLLAGRVRLLQQQVDAAQETRPALQGLAQIARQAEETAGALDTRPAEELLQELQQLLASELIALDRLGERRRRGLRVAPAPAEPAPARVRLRAR